MVRKYQFVVVATTGNVTYAIGEEMPNREGADILYDTPEEAFDALRESKYASGPRANTYVKEVEVPDEPENKHVKAWRIEWRFPISGWQISGNFPEVYNTYEADAIVASGNPVRKVLV